jgi:tRNA (guanine37-N1)-methyltransferase
VAHLRRRYDILTLFPEMFRGPFDESILKRAVEADLLTIRVHDIRKSARDRHHTADDEPFGGGAGMVMLAGPIFDAAEHAIDESRREGWPGQPAIILLAPQGRRFTQKVAEELAARDHLMLVCGHYEGVDDRVRQHLATDEVSIGDYVLTGGELAAMVVLDAVIRLLPGVLGSSDSSRDESHADGLLEYPQYTRPATYRGWAVPPVLLSGHHAEVAKWRRREALRRTFERRPDLLRTADLTDAERTLVRQWEHEGSGQDATSRATIQKARRR